LRNARGGLFRCGVCDTREPSQIAEPNDGVDPLGHSAHDASAEQILSLAARSGLPAVYPHRVHAQSSSASRFTADASGFFILGQSGERPERYAESFRFDTISSSPILQAWAKTVGPSLIEPNARSSLGQDHFECGFAALKRIMPQIVAVQLDQVEGPGNNSLTHRLSPIGHKKQER
jgi:hypothetical protein